MSIPQSPKPAKLLIGLFMKEKNLLEPAARLLAENFGPVDMISSWMDFDYTDYYERETGKPLFRRMLAFQTLTEQTALADIKIVTNEIEKKFSKDGMRNINIDPGYMLPERFVLASGKNFTHRIYIGKGIYADLTLIYTKGGFQKLPWTYPDYADAKMLVWLKQVRERYVRELRNEK
ncbi:MAG: GTP-binding protein [Desulfobacteraceae bacterium IS3]|nr:MAG: GTP-binding protein [Desulfobacteraceae bacterium IS3]